SRRRRRRTPFGLLHRADALVDDGRLQLDELPVERGDSGALLVPGVRDGVRPVAAALRVGRAPADRLEVGIARVVVPGVELDPVPVGVADVDVERVRDAVAPGAALDRGLAVRAGEDVADA